MHRSKFLPQIKKLGQKHLCQWQMFARKRARQVRDTTSVLNEKYILQKAKEIAIKAVQVPT